MTLVLFGLVFGDQFDADYGFLPAVLEAGFPGSLVGGVFTFDF